MDMQWVLTPQQQWMVAGVATTVVAVAVGLFVSWQARRLRRLDARIAQLGAALALLTDTVEAGFQDVMRGGSRETPVESVVPARPRANAQRRVRSASKRGRTVGDIAATERLSEGEVRLMLQMSGAQDTANRHADLR